jgi:hypothetical protein
MVFSWILVVRSLWTKLLKLIINQKAWLILRQLRLMINTLCFLINHPLLVCLMRNQMVKILLSLFIKKTKAKFSKILVLWEKVKRMPNSQGQGLKIQIRNSVNAVECLQRVLLGIWIIQGDIRMIFWMKNRICCKIFQSVIMTHISVSVRMLLRQGWYKPQFII